MDHWLRFVCLGCLYSSELWNARQLHATGWYRLSRTYKDRDAPLWIRTSAHSSARIEQRPSKPSVGRSNRSGQAIINRSMSRIEHNPYINRYHYNETELIRRKELQDSEREKVERIRTEYLDRIRVHHLNKGRYIDRMV